ncbi:ATP-binding protein [Micromonospora sp. CPCC 206060]|uniref:sensor histidine kinase n=1 Tax=Micromonospora sp. CPCC 206060 TaxID=3122406 RepID=UPI002FF14321
MVLGVLGLAAGLGLGGLVVLGVLSHALQRSVDTEAFHAADAVARLVDSDAVPDPLPVAGGQVRVQVIDGQGRVQAASIDADRLVPMLYPGEMAGTDRYRTVVPGGRLGMADPVRVVAVAAGPPDDRVTVLVARSMADVRHSVAVVRTILLIAFPLLVTGLAAVAWRVVGATLRPVEALRTGAEEIARSAGDRMAPRGPGDPAGDGGTGTDRLPVPASPDEIHRLAVTLNGMLDRLAVARARQRAFIADAAHELRSPLTNMRTELEVARRLGDRTDWPAVADDLLADTERLSRLVNDLLLLARLDDAGSRPLARSAPVDLAELVAAVAARYPSPPVRVRVPDHPVWTLGAPDELVRIVANLLDNAVRHAAGKVRLTVEAGVSVGKKVTGGPGGPTGAGGRGVSGRVAVHLVTVTDDGPGIPAQDRARVFDRFTRLDDARARDAGGTGLGLAIVRDLVHRHGGVVELADADGGSAGEPDADGDGGSAGEPDADGDGGSAGEPGAGAAVEGTAAAAAAGPGLRVTVRLPAAPDPAG